MVDGHKVQWLETTNAIGSRGEPHVHCSNMPHISSRRRPIFLEMSLRSTLVFTHIGIFKHSADPPNGANCKNDQQREVAGYCRRKY